MAPITVYGVYFDPDASDCIPQAPDAAGTNYILIQTNRLIDDVEKDELKSLGVVLNHYVCDDTYLCKYEPNDLECLRRLEYVHYADVFHPHLKIDTNLQPHDADPSAAAAIVDVIIALHNNPVPTSQEFADSLIAQGLIDREGTIVARKAIYTKIRADAVKDLAVVDCVRRIEKSYEDSLAINRARVVTAGGMYSTVNSSSQAIEEFTGKGQIVHIVDTGFDTGDVSSTPRHPAFDPARIKGFYNPFSYDSALFVDTESHGTAVAGVALANGTSTTMGGPQANTYGRLRGTAPDADFVITRNWDRLQRGYQGSFSDIMDKPYYDKGVRISNHSYNHATPNEMVQQPYNDRARDVDEYIFDHDDLLVVRAAGNEGQSQWLRAQIQDKAACKNSLTVGNCYSGRKIEDSSYQPRLDSESDPFEVHPRSTRGPVVGGRFKPDVCAPGVAILTTMSTRGYRITWFGDTTDPQWVFSSGSSLSAPHVTGLAAALRQALSVNGFNNPSAALMKALLINGAVDMFPADPLPDRTGQGFGRVNLNRTLQSLPGNDPNGFIDIRRSDPNALTQRRTSRPVRIKIPPWEMIVPDGELYGKTLTVTLVWTDRDGPDLVNRLGLSVNLNGVRRLGNRGEADMTPSPSLYDNINNVQQVVWHDCPPGDAYFQVECTKAFDSQERIGYAVVWSLD